MANVDLTVTPVAYFEGETVEEAGFYILEGDTTEDENGTVHESGMTPGVRVYPSPEGDGFQDAPPKEGK